MIVIHTGFGLSIKKGHMFGVRESKRKMLSIRLPFISIHWLNHDAEIYFYECARAAFNDPSWFAENHHAVRQAKRKAMITEGKAWNSAHAKSEKEYRGRLDDLHEENHRLKMKIQEANRDIQAYKKLLVGSENA